VTKSLTAGSLRRILRWLWEEHGAPKLDHLVRHYPSIRPRSVTVERTDIDAALAATPPHVRLWLLLCSDLALRAATAANIGPEHYHPSSGTIRFTTKKQAKLTLPVTAEIRTIFDACDSNSNLSFVRQLWLKDNPYATRMHTSSLNMTMSLREQMHRSLAKAGIHLRLRPHDLRRTAAVAMLEETGDVRDVQALLGHRSLQSTIWYLDHDLRPVSSATLEALKNPNHKDRRRA
jgi:integrase